MQTTKSQRCSMEGTLFRYGDERTQVAFQSGKHGRHVLHIAGLGDGLHSLPYLDPLLVGLESLGWSLVQVQLSSSYQGYGISSLDKDADELSECIKYLKSQRGCSQLMMVGHSTGCQNIVRFLQRYGQKEPFLSLLKGLVLQAGVSDQELGDEYPEMEKYRQEARTMVGEGKQDDIVKRDPTAPEGSPLTASRLLALYEHYGDDDMFSSYLTDKDLQERLAGMAHIPCLILQSGKDEFIPKHVDSQKLFTRVASAIGDKAEYEVIDDGIHDLKGCEQQGADAICGFLARI